MDQVVKRENEEEEKAEPMETASCEEVEDVILAELSRSSKLKPRPSSSTGNQKKPMDKKETLSSIKKGRSDSMMKHAVTSQAMKTMISSMKGKAAVDGLGGARSSALIQAQEVRSNLPPEYPSFVKSLVRSHVAGCFWMGLPGAFCKAYLPNKDTTVILEDECGKQYELKYIAYKTGLSAGWRQFSAAHKLLEGDVLIFQLVEPTKFKVYIIRPNVLTEVDGALLLLNLDAQTKQSCAGSSNTKRKRPKPHHFGLFEKKKKIGLPRSVTKLGQPAEQSENDSEEVGSEVLEGYKLSELAIQFKDIKSFQNFRILVDGIPMDSEFSEDIRKKYYKLCYSQKAFIHDGLVSGINFALIVGIIFETVNIADAIKASKLTTSREEFSAWDKTLQAFEHLGMNVRFLRSRLRRIVSLAYESEGATNARRYLEARTERGRTEDEISNIEAKLVELKEACYGFGSYIDSLKSKAESYDLKFQDL
ncbi:B3 domain-containing protein Os01g0234100-like isoform X2 [Alnus glutinosa]|uniref:B3 domain-containing protein Os01g0234100-like isoform X2 n=1 Tax=Alnus glutinosa TaxID=3517 RepID=UPI002D7A0B91|nr:B3 domain-containing protein Os01g0234100-like isoform X2 [Alnus glutinosa]